jgi:hypothetical protein
MSWRVLGRYFILLMGRKAQRFGLGKLNSNDIIKSYESGCALRIAASRALKALEQVRTLLLILLLCQ